MKNLTLASLLAIFFGIVGCEKNLPDPSSQPAEHHFFKVKDGRLVFKDIKAMQQFAIKVINNDALPAHALDQAPNFVSLKEIYNGIDFDYYRERPVDEILNKYPDVVTLVREGKEAYVMRNVTEDIEAQLINEQGIVQVADSIIKVTRDVIYIFPDRYLGQIANVEHIPGCRKIVSKTVQQSFESSLRGIQENCEDYYNDNKQKLKGRAGSREGLFTGNIDFFTESTHYKRGAFGIWFGQDTDDLSCGASGSVTVRIINNLTGVSTTATLPINLPTKTLDDRSNVLSSTEVLAQDAETGNTGSHSSIIGFSMDSYHSCEREDKQGYVSCYIYVSAP